MGQCKKKDMQSKKRKPISGKQKKTLLQERTARRRDAQQQEDLAEAASSWNIANAAGAFGIGDTAEVGAVGGVTLVEGEKSVDHRAVYSDGIISINAQPGSKGRNKYNLKFSQTKVYAELQKGKEKIYEDIQRVSADSLEFSSEDFFPEGLSLPQRPHNYQSMSPEQLDRAENKNLRLFIEDIGKKFNTADINLFEQNLETWRQLWRVIDKSDVLLYIVDIRFAVCHFPAYVYQWLQGLGKGVVLVLNKVDLVEPALVVAWQRYFELLCPGLQVVGFCSHESVVSRGKRNRLALHSCRTLVKAVAAATAAANKPVDMSSWQKELEVQAVEAAVYVPSVASTTARRRRVDAYEKDEFDEDGSDDDESCSSEHDDRDEGSGDEDDSVVDRRETFTLGTIGYPNVGKSSLINAIKGRAVVSVSRNPGHTKHFQTHYLTPDRRFQLCDCPGLVFAATCPSALQVLSGTFPIAQTRVPMAVVGWLAERIDVPRALRIRLPSDETAWTPYMLCESWAEKRKYRVKSRGGRVDAYRAANELLRLSLTAHNNLVLALAPPGYHRARPIGPEHKAALAEVRLLQGVHAHDIADVPALYHRCQPAPSHTVKKLLKKKKKKDDEEEDSDDDDDEDISDYEEDSTEESEKKRSPVVSKHGKNKFALLTVDGNDDDDDDDNDDDDEDDED